MATHNVTDADGNPVQNSEGKDLIWSDSDGDSPNDQTVYSDDGGIFGDTTKQDETYDPETGELK